MRTSGPIDFVYDGADCLGRDCSKSVRKLSAQRTSLAETHKTVTHLTNFQGFWELSYSQIPYSRPQVGEEEHGAAFGGAFQGISLVAATR